MRSSSETSTGVQRTPVSSAQSREFHGMRVPPDMPRSSQLLILTVFFHPVFSLLLLSVAWVGAAAMNHLLGPCVLLFAEYN